MLGVGSNLGRREENIRRGVALLAEVPGLTIVAESQLRETPPWGLVDQPAFLNGAILVRTRLAPLALLAATRRIEAALGRARDIRWGPRTLDIDLLWSDGLVVDEPDLSLPHPGLRDRIFALEPLLELVPEALDPRTGQPYVASLDSLRKG